MIYEISSLIVQEYVKIFSGGLNAGKKTAEKEIKWQRKSNPYNFEPILNKQAQRLKCNSKENTTEKEKANSYPFKRSQKKTWKDSIPQTYFINNV